MKKIYFFLAHPFDYAILNSEERENNMSYTFKTDSYTPPRYGTMEYYLKQGLTLWQAGEASRAMAIASSYREEGNYYVARQWEGEAINAGNLPNGVSIRVL